MAGPSGHGQKNKPHKPGRHASASARSKHQAAKAGGHRQSIKASSQPTHSKQQRHQVAAARSCREPHGHTTPLPAGQKHKGVHGLYRGRRLCLLALKMLIDADRAQKREEGLSRRRNPGAPLTVCPLPLSGDVDLPRLWGYLVAACQPEEAQPPVTPRADRPQGMELEEEHLPTRLQPCTLAVPGQTRQLRLLPPPTDRSNPLDMVAVASTAEVVLLVLPGDKGSVLLDTAGEAALAVLRTMGLPGLMAAVQGSNEASLKERAAAKKLGEAAVSSQIPGEHRVLAANSPKDAQQVLRLLADSHPSLPLWRQQRPSVSIDEAEAAFDTSDAAATGTVIVRGFVRGLGLSVNQAVHIQGCNDFLLQQAAVLPVPDPDVAPTGARKKHAGAKANSSDAHMSSVLVPDPVLQDSLQRLNEADPLQGEQTWPTAQELADAHAAPSTAPSRKRLPKGTSDYQAAWITEAAGPDDLSSGSDDEDAALPQPQGHSMEEASEAGGSMEDDDETADMLDVEDGDSQLASAAKKRRRAEQDDIEFPDEMDTPDGVPARQRFARYRGLKSFRASPWDPKEDLPAEYAQTFAFENFKRAHKRARAAAEAAGKPGDVHGVAAGSYVELHFADVPADAAQRVVQATAAFAQGEGMPILLHGLLQHETKLSVLNFSIRKSSSSVESIPNKAELLFCSGLRTFSARPILSSDEPQADKHKLERYLHDGRQVIASVYGPISYPPLPLLVFRQTEGGSLELVALGSLRSCNPDRVVLKKITLSGYPVKVHKKKAVVRWMFHSPDDVRWFRPLELWTKHGRRGRIKEPVGTHGSMKCIFDGNIKQSDAVCTSLYKRSYPVWPSSLTF